MSFSMRARPSFSRRAVQRGVTLIEILVVITIIAVVSGVAIGGSMQLPNARLRRSATMIASAIKVAYTRATATSKDLRLVMDLDEPRIWLEESDAPMLVQSKDRTGTGGADAVTEAERAAIAEGEKILKGPPVPKPQFHSIQTYGFADTEEGKGAKALQRGISFRAVQIAHDETAHTSGRAYLYFWRGGLTERASIQIRIGTANDDARTLTLLVSPLTGKVSVKAGAAELQVPPDDEHASDRTDTGL
jgi:general secretion pathway protein H